MFTELVISLFMDSFEHLIDWGRHIDPPTALNILANGPSGKYDNYFKRFYTEAPSTGNADGAGVPALGPSCAPSGGDPLLT